MQSVLKLIAPVAACVIVAACSSTTNGSGIARQPSSHPSSTESVPASSDSATPTNTQTSATSSAMPTQAPAPPECQDSSCTTVATASLGAGYVIELRSGPPSNGSAGASVVELTLNGVPTYWNATDDATPANLTCNSGATANCVIADYVGAHGSVATVWSFANRSLKQGKSVNADSPSIFGRDLNADGYIDVVGLQNNYIPNYATGKVQWQTWLSDGSNLTSTGCTVLKMPPPSPRPTTPATGKCTPY